MRQTPLRPIHALVGAALAGLLCAAPSIAAAAGPAFTLSAKGLHDNSTLSQPHAASAQDANGQQCGGKNVSPALEWKNAPSGTKSYAVTIFDPEGASGLGIVHWVLYGIPASTHGLAEGVGEKGPDGTIGGTNRTGKTGYYGPCPPIGDTPHHYFFQAYALDLEPDALQPAMTRDALIGAMRNHVLATSALVLRFGRKAPAGK
jgi:Raf kinase inhibitor-like YbhB/YbcL family protein